MTEVWTGDEDESGPGDPLAEDPSQLPVPGHGVEVGGGSSREGALGDTRDVPPDQARTQRSGRDVEMAQS